MIYALYTALLEHFYGRLSYILWANRSGHCSPLPCYMISGQWRCTWPVARGGADHLTHHW